MASKRKAFLSRSVSLSLAALIVLTGAMFLITTLEEDHQEWKLVEDQVFELEAITSLDSNASSYVTEGFDSSFDEGVYSIEIPADVSKGVTNTHNILVFSVVDSFDYSKNYKISISSEKAFRDFFYSDNYVASNTINLRSIQSDDDGVYFADVILLDQFITDLSFKDYWMFNYIGENSSSFDANNITIQVYTLEDDNAGSIAAAITGLTLIVMGVFATPMLNVFRRRR